MNRRVAVPAPIRPADAGAKKETTLSPTFDGKAEGGPGRRLAALVVVAQR